MNFIPKEIKDSLNIFKKSFQKLFYTTSMASDMNFSKVLENIKDCSCEDKCSQTCPFIPTAFVDLERFGENYTERTQDFLITIKELNVLTNVKNSLYCLCISLEHEKKKNIILFKGMINDYKIFKKNVSYPIKLNLPNKLTFKIILLDKNGNKTLFSSNNILNMGIIDLGLIFL